LDEAGILTNDPSAIRRAQTFFDQLCSEPVRPEYLKKCIAAYRPPRFGPNAPTVRGKTISRRIARVWVIGGLVYDDLPEAEAEKVKAAQTEAEARLRNSKGTSADYIHFPSRPSYFQHIRDDDWIIACVRNSQGRRTIEAPAQVLKQTTYPRRKGKRRYLLWMEVKNGAETMTLGEFRKRVKRPLPKLDRPSPRTCPITNDEHADLVLRLWTHAGRVSRKRR
jgi:hypothetical protein